MPKGARSLALAGWTAFVVACTPPDESDVLHVAESRTVTIGDEIHRYRLPMKTGFHGRVVVEQLEADVSLYVRASEDDPGFEHDFRTTPWQEAASFVVEGGGAIVEIRPSRPGRYRVRLDDVRPPSREDFARAAGDRLVADAYDLLLQHEAAGLARALVVLERAGDEYRAAGDAAGEALCDELRGVTNVEAGFPERAVPWYRKALEHYRHSGDRLGQADCLNNLGVAVGKMGRWQEEAAYYREALPLYRTLANPSLVGSTLHNLAAAAAEQGNWQEALVSYRQAIAAAREAGEQDAVGDSLRSLGVLLSGLGAYDEALRHFEQALAIERAAGRHRSEALTLDVIGKVHLRRGELAKAEQLFVDAHALATRSGSGRTIQVALRDLGLVAMARGDARGALRHLQPALAAARDAGDRINEASLLRQVGQAMAGAGRSEEARNHLEAALDAERRNRAPRNVALVLGALAALDVAEGDFVNAQQRLSLAVDTVDRLRGGLARPDHRMKLVASTVGDLYRQLVDVLVAAGRRDESDETLRDAFVTVQRGRARSLLDLLTASRDRDRQTTSARPRLDLAADQLDAAAWQLERLLVSPAEAGLVAAAEQRLDERLAAYRAAEGEASRDLPRWSAIAAPRLLDIEAVQQELLDDETLWLEVALGTPESHLWLIGNDRAIYRPLPSRETIETAARRLHDLASRSDQLAVKGGFDVAARDLAELILGPIAEELDARRLVIATDGALRYVPFATLPRPVDAGRPLVADLEVIHAPSASVLSALRAIERPEAPPSTLLAIADPVFAPDDPRVGTVAASSAAAAAAGAWTASLGLSGPSGLARLPYSRREAESIAQRVPVTERHLALDFDADAERLTDGTMSDYRFLHFATHAVLHAERPELSGLVLSLVDASGQPRDGFLRAHRLAGLSLNADLVVLSGCRTALGQEIRGEGLVGLSQALFLAGARSLVLSLWDVGDEATAALMDHFYEALLADGLHPAAALRVAQEQLRSEPRWRAPAHWAGFVYLGDWSADGSPAVSTNE